MWAIVPLKSPQTAKSRLAAALSDDERRELFFGLARRVIAVLRATPGISQVAVVTSSDEVAAFARESGARVLHQSRDEGTAQAFAEAVTQLRVQGIDQLLMIAGDLPLITTQAVETLLEAATRHDVVIVPDRFGVGTNALLCSPPDAIPPCFGPDSLALHLAAARAAKLSHRALPVDELALDVDVPADLDYLRALQGVERPARSSCESSCVLAGDPA